MERISPSDVQARLDRLQNKALYLHLESTTGAYATHLDSSKHPASAFISNARIRYAHGLIAGNGPYRVGLKTETGWVYAEGLTHWEETESERLILAGHDSQGKLVVTLMLSPHPF